MQEIIKFGSYYQKNKDLKEPIEWLVLDDFNGKKLLLSKDVLDVRAIHQALSSITWETCDLRKWLNEDFLNLAFTKEEQKHLLLVKNKNLDNPFSNTNGGNKTYDKVFLLSKEELEKYLSGYQCQGTAYANNKNKFNDKEFMYWWLRSIGDRPSSMLNITNQGDISQRSVHCDYYGIRPVIWVDFNNEAVFIQEEKKIVEFGHYYQENNEVKTPIKWRVLTENDTQMLLISETGLAHQIFDMNCNSDFNESGIKEWLNHEFLNNAFNECERQYLIEAVRLLRFEEALKYFDDRNDRKIAVNPYLLSLRPNLERFREYWLETNGLGGCVMMINSDGSINKGGILARFANIIRPVILVKKGNIFEE